MVGPCGLSHKRGVRGQRKDRRTDTFPLFTAEALFFLHWSANTVLVNEFTGAVGLQAEGEVMGVEVSVGLGGIESL